MGLKFLTHKGLVNRIMIGSEKDHRALRCPACGESVRLGFGQFTTKEKVKAVLVLSLVGYFVVSVFLLGLSLPPDMRRHNTPTSYDPWLQLLSSQPIFQMLVGGGLVIGVLAFYLDWFHTLYVNWRKKRAGSREPAQAAYKYTCRSCGRQWN
jgi:hypothetical protein